MTEKFDPALFQPCFGGVAGVVGHASKRIAKILLALEVFLVALQRSTHVGRITTHYKKTVQQHTQR